VLFLKTILTNLPKRLLQNRQKKNDGGGGRLYCFVLSAVHTDKLRAKGNVPYRQKKVGKRP